MLSITPYTSLCIFELALDTWFVNEGPVLYSFVNLTICRFLVNIPLHFFHYF